MIRIFLSFLLVPARFQDEISSAPKRARSGLTYAINALHAFRQDQVIRGERHLLCAQGRKFDDNMAFAGTLNGTEDYSFTKH
jgi:hypothetical protein